MNKCVHSRSASVAFAVICMLAYQSVLAFGFPDVARRAQQLASKGFNDRSRALPEELSRLTYAQYREIRFKPDRFYWRNVQLRFELGFVHEGDAFREAVKINEVSSDGVREIKFDPDDFDYGSTHIEPKKMRGLGFAGFRVYYPVNRPDYKDEVTVFLGASYFRAVGNGQRYGLSARGLAVDTGLTSGEEFPRFVEFWIERPAPLDKHLVIYALLDSKRMSGAYRFVLKPGTDTTIDVKAQLHLRDSVGTLGMAPLTSMYFSGENQRSPVDDYRPEVHDSDGLSLDLGNDEWIWRPLVNPKRLLITSFGATDPRGFGLMQRDRAFDSYEDLDARYELRPSAWVAPKGKWGSGQVELVQIPTPDETNDNVVAFWVPSKLPPAHRPYNIEYRILWQKKPDTRPSTSWVTQSRRGFKRTPKTGSIFVFAVDFDGPALQKLAADAIVESMVSANANGQVLENSIQRNDITGARRMILRVKRIDDKAPVELRAQLRRDGKALSETWSYILPPE